MEFAACIVPAAPVRKKASHKVEMINQLLFGESMRVLKQRRNWVLIQSLHDNYEGWIRNNLVTGISEDEVTTSFVVPGLLNQIMIAGTKMNIPVGSSLPLMDDGRGRVGNIVYEFRGPSIDRKEAKPSEDLVKQLSGQWLNAPYLWGGRTPLGVDCSGFVQVIFRMMGMDLLRDAWLQAGQGIKVKTLEEARCGDLAFFKNKKGKTTHVGILLNSSQLIHASGKVRIDAVDRRGIINGDTGKRTHSIATIRRYW